jgi:predicted phage terminase large subunit-like protein
VLSAATAYHDAGYAPHKPTPRQLAGLLLPQLEVLYGGAAGGGKTDWELLGALQYVDVPGYAALCLRRTFAQLNKSDGLIPRSHEWLAGTDARWSAKDARWTFPSGALLEFGHVQHEVDKYNYQGAAYQMIAFDELTQFSESIYRYLLSRLRRPKDPNNPVSRIPLRVRSGSNPGGVGHDWVKQRFMTDLTPNRVFIPAKLSDNPYLDAEEYAKSLALLDPITRAQLLNGDWAARASGGFFKREWIDFVDAAPNDVRQCRGWDLASTKLKLGTDPDWTAGAKVSEKNGHFFVGPIIHDRYSPNELDRVLVSTANMDMAACKVRIEEEPGSSGKIATAHFVKLLAGFDVRGRRPTGSKLKAFAPFASQCEGGNVSFVSGAWNSGCIDELEALTHDDSHAHDDYADAISLAFNELTTKASRWGDATDLMGEAA